MVSNIKPFLECDLVFVRPNPTPKQIIYRRKLLQNDILFPITDICFFNSFKNCLNNEYGELPSYDFSFLNSNHIDTVVIPDFLFVDKNKLQLIKKFNFIIEKEIPIVQELPNNRYDINFKILEIINDSQNNLYDKKI